MEKPEIKPVTHEDVKSMVDARKWFYTPTVREHFFNPKNIFKTEEEVKNYKADGIGMVGSPACTEGKRTREERTRLEQ